MCQLWKPTACTAYPQAPSPSAYPPQTGAGATRRRVGRGQRGQRVGNRSRNLQINLGGAFPHSDFLPPAPTLAAPLGSVPRPQRPRRLAASKSRSEPERERSWQRAPRCGRSEPLMDGAGSREAFLPSSSVLS